MRISDWSSDVCSSDLARRGRQSGPAAHGKARDRAGPRLSRGGQAGGSDQPRPLAAGGGGHHQGQDRQVLAVDPNRSEERGRQGGGRGGNREGVGEVKVGAERENGGGWRNVNKKNQS